MGDYAIPVRSGKRKLRIGKIGSLKIVGDQSWKGRVERRRQIVCNLRALGLDLRAARCRGRMQYPARIGGAVRARGIATCSADLSAWAPSPTGSANATLSFDTARGRTRDHGRIGGRTWIFHSEFPDRSRCAGEFGTNGCGGVFLHHGPKRPSGMHRRCCPATPPTRRFWAADPLDSPAVRKAIGIGRVCSGGGFGG